MKSCCFFSKEQTQMTKIPSQRFPLAMCQSTERISLPMFIFGNEQQTVVKSHFQSAHSSPVRRSARIATSLTMAVNCLTIQLETLANKLFPLAISCLWNLNLPLFHAKCGKRICSHGGNWLRSRHLCQRITAMKMIVFDRSLF